MLWPVEIRIYTETSQGIGIGNENENAIYSGQIGLSCDECLHCQFTHCVKFSFYSFLQ